jgi:SAM-dependent methyltransferase
MAAGDQRRFWDARAREDAYWFVDSRGRYRAPDLDAFWASGADDLDTLLGLLGAAVAPEDRVVEIGCGIGRMTRALAARAAHVRALDVSPEMLARARTENADPENVEWILGDGESLPGVADASADAVISNVVFQHIPDPAVTLGYVREMGRVLAPGGWAGFQVSNDPAVHRPRATGLGDRLRSLAGAAPRGRADPRWLGSAVDLDELRSVASGAGMATERVVGAGTQFCGVLLRRARE